MTALDDICWLLNIRGDDVQFNPVVYGYVLVTMDAVHLFIHEGREVRAAGVGLQLHPYAEFLPFLETVARDASVKLCYDENDVSFAVKQVLAPLKPAVVFEWALCAGLTRSPVAVMKSRKNPTEIASLEEAFLADSVAMCHLLAWLADSVDSHITEADAAAKSTELRRALAHSLSDSFAPIVGCAGNAAIVHYEPEPATAAPLVRDKCILLDTGGQYHWGTTDITHGVPAQRPRAEPRGHGVPAVLHGGAQGPHRADDRRVPRGHARRAAGLAGAPAPLADGPGLRPRHGPRRGLLPVRARGSGGGRARAE